MKTKRASPLDYAFAVGKIRALEKFLLKSEVFEEAIAAGLNEALRLFVEPGFYSEELLQVKDSQQLEAVVNQELFKLKRLISGLLLDKQLLVLLELKSIESMQEIIKNYPSDFLKDYLKHLIDMHNIKTFLRLYFLKEAPEKLEKTLTSEGFLKKEDFLKLYGQELSAFLKRLEYVHKHNHIVDYAAYLKEAIQKIEKENSFVTLERATNDFLIQVLKPAKYLSFGPESILAYYFAKVNEINLIRMIVLAKLNNVSNALVKERLNAVYA